MSPDLHQPSLCVSDLHLESPEDGRFLALAALLQAAATRRYNLLLLGDLCEVWVGDDDDGPLANAFRDLLAHLARQTFVGLMHGNRDFLYGDALAQDTGIALLPDPWLLGEQVLLAHGDALCTDDTAYQQVRSMFRSPAWQQDILSQSLPARREFAAQLRAQSRGANANKAANIMDVNSQASAAAVADAGAAVLLHGHTHRPGIHRAPGHQRVVLGDWQEVGWAALIAPQRDGPPRLQLGCQAVTVLANDPESLLAALGGPL